ncbi:hypothetical protein I302_100102 [Kwoniella bestiolae CBS 10118]|uniref:Uncharacterized protein n=1 Tax=Kwoniella bestiolae CBS 10118 TaxID=1296100 RepID=A0A1B9G462_9TREE|nr:hypothetical protein I302_03476 [Kwoniella bestiolae CBS 10118]OCF25803.1 hypothetical protein I302_03476 [Kwoniella bestiolae CBS 10118]
MTIASSDISQWSIASSEDYQSSDDGLEPSTPPIVEHLHASHLNSYSHILTVPTHIRTAYLNLQAQSKNLTINKDNASIVFANIHSPSHPTYNVEIGILNKVERLTIQDLEAARAVAFTLNHPSSPIFNNVKTISLGAKLATAILNSSFHGCTPVNKVLGVLGCMLDPSHFCISRPSSTKGYDELWPETLFENLSGLLNSWSKLESYTSHGFWLYNGECLPPTIHNINIKLPDCPYSPGSAGRCTCHRRLRDGLDTIISMYTGEVDGVLRDKIIKVSNLPHITPGMITIDQLIRIKIRWEGGEPVRNLDGGVVDIRVGSGEVLRGLRTTSRLSTREKQKLVSAVVEFDWTQWKSR